jgi:hypothetical protein
LLRHALTLSQRLVSLRKLLLLLAERWVRLGMACGTSAGKAAVSLLLRRHLPLCS